MFVKKQNRPFNKGRQIPKYGVESFDLGKMRLLSFKTFTSPAFFGLCKYHITDFPQKVNAPPP
jgi:hypothetical protein